MDEQWNTPKPGEESSAGGYKHDGRLLDYKQAARYLAISEEHLRRLKSQGKIPFVPMGRRSVRFRVRTLNEWVERREIG